MFYNFRMEPEGSMISCKKYFLSVPNFLMSKIQNMTFFYGTKNNGLRVLLDTYKNCHSNLVHS